MNFEIQKTKEFEKEFTKFKNKFKTLEKDFENFLKYSLFLFLDKNINKNCFFSIGGIGVNVNENIKFFVAKKFACDYLKGKGAKSGFRVVFCFDKISNKITFIEIYHKGDKAVEDLERVKKIWENLV